MSFVRKLNKGSRVAQAAVLAAGFSVVAVAANATPYGYASNQDSGFTITPTGGTYTVVPGGSTFVTTNSTNTSGLPTPPFSVSTGQTASGPAGADALQATNGPGPFPGQNVFTQALTASNGLRADSVDSGFGGSGANVAEGRLVAAPGGATGSSSGSLRSSTLAFTVGAGTSLTISFNDAIGMVVNSDPLSGESASATITSSVAITDSTGTVLFEFAPTGGGARAIAGGNITSDPFSLNRTITSTFGFPVGGVSVFNSGFFSATSNPLAAGTYNIVIGQISRQDLTVGAPVPEPASMMLLTAGLIGLGVFGRKKYS